MEWKLSFFRPKKRSVSSTSSKPSLIEHLPALGSSYSPLVQGSRTRRGALVAQLDRSVGHAFELELRGHPLLSRRMLVDHRQIRGVDLDVVSAKVRRIEDVAGIIGRVGGHFDCGRAAAAGRMACRAHSAGAGCARAAATRAVWRRRVAAIGGSPGSAWATPGGLVRRGPGCRTLPGGTCRAGVGLRRRTRSYSARSRWHCRSDDPPRRSRTCSCELRSLCSA